MIHVRSMRQAFWVLAAAACLCVTGCASFSGPAPSTITMRVTPDGVLLLDDTPVLMAKLPHELKSRGANSQTSIHVAVPEQPSSQQLRQITETLATSGFPRVIFTKPQKASAATR